MAISKKAVNDPVNIEKVSKLLQKLDIKYKETSHYILSFIHRSIVNERPDFTPEHNERLEFLWDAVLELVITDKLFKDFPKKPEWELTDIRSALVRWKNLAVITRELGFSDYLFMWNWEEKMWWRSNDYILANTLEAFIGAMYVDLWIEKTRDFIIKHIYKTLDSILENNLTKDYKTLYQEYSQSKYDITPNYKLISDSWPDHDKHFEVGVFLEEKMSWTWQWTSKKKAQEQAAKNAYMNISWDMI